MARTPRTHTRGIIRALWSLVQPDGFKSRKPSHRNVSYREGRGSRGIKPRADLYLPEGPGPHPSIVLIHGGGYLIGSKSMKPMRFLATRAVEAGWAAVSIDYRMIFRGGRFEEALADVSDATTWWLDHARDFGCDPARVAMLGVSAGAALMLQHVEQSARQQVKYLVSVYGLYDFTFLTGRGTAWLRRRAFKSPDPARWEAFSPVGHCRTPTPLLILHGNADTIVPVEHAHRLVAHRGALPTETVFFDDAEHSFLNDANHPATLASLEKIWRFLGEDDA